ncbi:MAG: hypothetical protein LBS07_02200 [Prevotellaceae bacterium]|jgi:hypothetical protein|nr:hypothetical protein [Prevotellaceae bacterium]
MEKKIYEVRATDAPVIIKVSGKAEVVIESTPPVEPHEIHLRLNSYEKACEYLGRDGRRLFFVCHGEHQKEINAIFKLITIAEAWNAADGFVPDWTNRQQCKYFPWFSYYGADAGFVCARAYGAASATAAHVGSRLCFRTRELANLFGQQFIDLWNDFLL